MIATTVMMISVCAVDAAFAVVSDQAGDSVDGRTRG